MRKVPCGNRPRQRLRDWAYATFDGARCAGSCFDGAQLQYASFLGADLRGARLRDVDARGAVFDDADLTGADLSEALLQGARFRRARLWHTSFRQTLLLSAHLEGAQVHGASFAGANLEWAWVTDVDFRDACLSCAVLLNARGLSEDARLIVEQRGGFTGIRAMILGRELFETTLLTEPETECGRKG